MSSTSPAHGSGARSGGRPRKKLGGHAAQHEDNERWLLTYADMITLLMALFMVLFSISAVNTTKFHYLEKSLKEAFSGHILPGGTSILKTGSAVTPSRSLTPTHGGAAVSASALTRLAALTQESEAATLEQEDLQSLARRLNAYAATHGFADQVTAIVERRGLVVTVLTDKLLFASGQASLQAAGNPLLDEISSLLLLDRERHPIVVEGYTDDQPIATAEFPSNWELSTDRAATVVRYLLGRGVPEDRLSAAGYADQFPVASNATTAGRAMNRRVQIVLERINPLPPTTQGP